MNTHMVVLAIFTLAVSTYANAAEYRVSNNPTSGEISVSQLKAISCFNAGDFIRFKRDQSFQHYFTFKSCSSSPAGVVQVGSYGSGARPRLIGSKNAAQNGYSWSFEPNPTQGGQVITFLQNTGIYRMNNLPEEVVGVIYNNEQMDFARNPNRSLNVRFRPNYFDIQATSRDVDGCGISTCVRLELRSDGSDPLWMFKTYGLPSNSYVMMREENWAIKRFSLDWISPTLPSFASQTPITIPGGQADKKLNGMGAIVFGALSLLNTQKEWYFDPVDSTLYFWPPAGQFPPVANNTKLIFKSGHTGSICGNGSASDRAGVVCAWGRGNVGFKFVNLDIENAANDGIRVVDPKSVEISNVIVERSTNYGIRVFNRSSKSHTTSFVKILNSTLKFNSMAGLRVSGYGMSTTKAPVGLVQIDGNTITDNGFLNNQTSTDRQGFAGVRTEGRINNLTVTNNAIKRSGYALMMSGPALASLDVSNNTISHYCIMLNDCGGVYINATGQSGGAANRSIVDNDFSLPYGNTDGTNGSIALVAGVYIDFAGDGYYISSNNFDGHNNFIGGVFMNGGQGNLVSSNIFNTYTPPHIGYGTFHSATECIGGNDVIANVVDGPSGIVAATYAYTNPGTDPCLN